jgi:hypothetical protein
MTRDGLSVVVLGALVFGNVFFTRRSFYSLLYWAMQRHLESSSILIRIYSINSMSYWFFKFRRKQRYGVESGKTYQSNSYRYDFNCLNQLAQHSQLYPKVIKKIKIHAFRNQKIIFYVFKNYNELFYSVFYVSIAIFFFKWVISWMYLLRNCVFH